MAKWVIDNEKVKNAIAYFCIEHKKSTGKYPSQMFVYKYLSLLDFLSVERFGVPSLGINYCAMKMGPVPSDIYDSRGFHVNDKVAMLPVAADDTQYIFEARCKEASLDMFSKAEVDLMRNLVIQYSNRPLDDIIDATHALRAWRLAFGDGSKGRVRMQFQDQIEEGADDARLEALSLYEFFKE